VKRKFRKKTSVSGNIKSFSLRLKRRGETFGKINDRQDSLSCERFEENSSKGRNSERNASGGPNKLTEGV